MSRREPGKRGVGVGRDSKDGVFDYCNVYLSG